MFPIFNILAALPWRLIGASVLATVLFAGGCQFGTNRVTVKWDAEKVATSQVVAKQAEHVAAVVVRQSTSTRRSQMNFRKPKQQLLLIASICLLVFLSACVSTPQIVPAQCPPFPALPPELMRPPPTLYLLPTGLLPPSAKD